MSVAKSYYKVIFINFFIYLSINVLFNILIIFSHVRFIYVPAPHSGEVMYNELSDCLMIGI